MKFSERMGLEAVSDAIQTQGMNDALRNSLWNVLDACFWSRDGFVHGHYGTVGDIDAFSRNLWANHFKARIDSRPGRGFEILNEIREYFFKCKWYQVYNFLEFVLQTHNSPRIATLVNGMLERELAGFRVIDNLFVPITDEQERAAVEKAIAPGPYAGVQAHLRAALQHISNRERPDYRNSIKESISAVESIACELSGEPKATLGDGLKVLEHGGQLHGALKAGFSALYGYTSDADGIRHSMLDEPHLDAADAIFFLVSCASFVNYLKAKRAKAT